jgi:hypothetical protein
MGAVKSGEKRRTCEPNEDDIRQQTEQKANAQVDGGSFGAGVVSLDRREVTQDCGAGEYWQKRELRKKLTGGQEQHDAGSSDNIVVLSPLCDLDPSVDM